MHSSILTQTTDQKKKAALCSTMSPETFALLQNLLTREVTDVSYEEVKAAINTALISMNNVILSLRVSIYSERFSRTVNLSLISWLNCAIKAKECDFEEQCCVKCQDNTLQDSLVMGCRHTFIQ